MRLKDINLTTGRDSLTVTYLQADELFNKIAVLIKESKYDLFYDSEDLSEKEIIKKYNEINTLGFLFGLCCEYYLKYILLCTKIIDDPNINIEEIWDNNQWKSDRRDKGIKRHTIVELFEKIDEFYPGFTNVAVSVMQNYEENKITNGGELSKFAIQPFYIKYLDFQKDVINDTLGKYSDIFVDSRYMMQNKKDVDLKKILMLTENIQLLSHMIYISKNQIDINYGVAYIRTMLENNEIKNQILKIRSEEEINKILSLDKICSNSKLLFLALVNDSLSVDKWTEYNNSSYDAQKIYLEVLKEIGHGYSKYLSNNINEYETTLFGPISEELPNSLPKRR